MKSKRNNQNPLNGTTVSREVTVLHPHGLHARPAALFVKKATGFPCEIYIAKKGLPPVSAKSIMGLLTIEAHKGTELIISADGDRATQAVDDLVALIEANFNLD